MTTEQPTLKIRAATPLDAVNLYKLLVGEEQNSGIGERFDVAARLAHILHVIATGYVAVAEKSGRLVGTIGFSAGGPSYADRKTLVSEWYFLIPSLLNTKVPASFVNRVVRFADKHGVAISFSGLSVDEGGALDEALAGAGFGEPRTTVTRPAVLNDSEQESTASAAEGSVGEDSDPTEPV